jgi:hypothetical protein
MPPESNQAGAPGHRHRIAAGHRSRGTITDLQAKDGYMKSGNIVGGNIKLMSEMLQLLGAYLTPALESGLTSTPKPCCAQPPAMFPRRIRLYHADGEEALAPDSG